MEYVPYKRPVIPFDVNEEEDVVFNGVGPIVPPTWAPGENLYTKSTILYVLN